MGLGEAENFFSQQKNERPKLRAFVFWFLVLIAADQILKYWIFSGGRSQKFIGLYPYLGLMNFKNSNFAFSLQLPIWLIYLVYTVILIIIVYYLIKNYSAISRQAFWAWCLILAGAFSNVGERIVLGYVRDFIYILSGIFNLADGYIILGVAVLLFAERVKLNAKGL